MADFMYEDIAEAMFCAPKGQYNAFTPILITKWEHKNTAKERLELI